MNPRILVGEDDIVLANNLKDRLEMMRYGVAGISCSGEDAVRQAAEVRPDLVLMDIRLPGRLDAVAAAGEICARLDIPVVYLAGSSDEATLQQAQTAVPHGCVLDPFEMQELRTAIEMALYRHSTEKKLRESEERYRLLFERNLAGVYRVTLDGQFLDCNPAFARILGYDSPEELLALPVTEFYFDPDERGGFLARLQRQGSLSNLEWCLRRKDGNPVWVLETASLVGGADDASAVIEGIIVDVTDRKQMEQALLYRERLVAMGQLAAALAHEINNPLQAIGSNLELVLDFPLPEEERQQCMQTVRDEVQRLMGLTRRMLDFARPPTIERELVSLAEAIHHALSLSGKQLQNTGIQVNLNLPDILPEVMASRDQLTQVFLNLILNAMEAMAAGGELDISARHIGECIELKFADSGPGLPFEILDKLFEPFYTTRERGIGLGLSISHSIVQQHGGTISAGNAPEGGAVIVLTFPMAPPGDDQPEGGP